MIFHNQLSVFNQLRVKLVIICHWEPTECQRGITGVIWPSGFMDYLACMSLRQSWELPTQFLTAHNMLERSYYYLYLTIYLAFKNTITILLVTILPYTYPLFIYIGFPIYFFFYLGWSQYYPRIRRSRIFRPRDQSNYHL